MDSQQVLDLGGQPITLKKIKGKMKDEGSVESVKGSVASVVEQEGSVELSAKRKKAKKDKGQTKITNFIPKAAANAGSTILGLMVGVGLMFLKGVEASCSSRGWRPHAPQGGGGLMLLKGWRPHAPQGGEGSKEVG